MALEVKRQSRAGLIDWIIQRCTAVFLAAYTIFIIGCLLGHVSETFETWHSLFSNLWMRIFTILALFGILWHAWIGLWTVFTDYVKPKLVRYVLQLMVILLLLIYFVWLLNIFWR